MATGPHSRYKCLRRGARAVLQFYPTDSEQLQLITASAMRAGFGGGLVIDYPHSTKAKKYFLVLLAGPPEDGFAMPVPMGADAMSCAASSAAPPPAQARNAARVEGRKKHARRKMDTREKSRHGKIAKKSAEWIAIKKEAHRRQGKEVARDSKYTGRRRSKVKF